MATTITLSGNHSVAADAAWGTVIGTFNVTGVRLLTNPWGYFGYNRSTHQLMVAWQGVVATPGVYPVEVRAPGSGSPTTINITITPVPIATTPTPSTASLNPAAVSLPYNSAAGAVVSTLSVAMSDGSAFSGVTSISPAGMVQMGAGGAVVLARGLTAADAGPHSFIVTASENGGTARAMLTLNVTAVAPPTAPTVQVNGSPSPTTVAGGAVITATVANGPGNPGDFLGIFAVGAPPSINALSWKWLATDNQQSQAPSAGVTSGTVHLAAPTQPGQYEVRFLLNNTTTLGAVSPPITVTGTVPPPPPTLVLSISPPAPRVPDTARMGTVVATIGVKYSDGTPATVTLTSTVSSLFAVSGMNIVLARDLTSADDGPNGTDRTYNVTITATDNAGLAPAATMRLFGGAPG